VLFRSEYATTIFMMEEVGREEASSSCPVMQG
jgi:hypothetical protein